MGYAQTAEAEKKMKTRLDESGYKEEQKNRDTLGKMGWHMTVPGR